MTETNALGLGISGDEYVEKPELAEDYTLHFKKLK